MIKYIDRGQGKYFLCLFLISGHILLYWWNAILRTIITARKMAAECPKGWMKMKFDRNAYSEGVDTDSIFESGRILLTWRFKYCGETEDAQITLILKDPDGRTVLTCLRREPEEEPLQAVLLRPRLWKGIEDPYLYVMDVFLWSQSGQLLDRVTQSLPLRNLQRLPGGNFYLNGSIFQPKTINYSLPKAESQAKQLQAIWEDIRLLQELGANSVHCDAMGPALRQLVKLCDRIGILIWPEPGEFCLRGKENGLLNPATGIPNEQFYSCKAKWSRQRFVYISPESIRTTGEGDYAVTVYSNCSRVALYSDGVLSAFQSGEYEFVFEHVLAGHPCVMLTAEADECSMSFAAHRSSISRRA